MRKAWRDRIEALEGAVAELRSAVLARFEELEFRIRTVGAAGEGDSQELREDLRQMRRTLDAVLMERTGSAPGLHTLLQDEVEEDPIDPEEQEKAEEDWKQFRSAFTTLYGEGLNDGE